MKTLSDLPEAQRARAQQHAKIMLERKASNAHSDVALHALYMLGAIISADPDFWKFIEAIAAGDFDKADELTP